MGWGWRGPWPSFHLLSDHDHDNLFWDQVWCRQGWNILYSVSALLASARLWFFGSLWRPILRFACTKSSMRVQISLLAPKSSCFDRKRLRKVNQGFLMSRGAHVLVDGFQPQICQFWREKILKSKYSSAPDRVPCPVYYRQLPGLLADKRWILMWGWTNWNIEILCEKPYSYSRVTFSGAFQVHSVVELRRVVESDWTWGAANGGVSLCVYVWMCIVYV